MQRSTFKVLFYVKRQSEKHGQVPVMGRITINGTMSQFSCKLSVRSSLWDAKANKASGKSLESQRINEKLENIKTNIGKQYQRLCDRDSYVTAEKVRNAFLGMGDDCRLLLQTFDEYLAEFRKRVGKDRAYSTYEDYCLRRRRLAAFLEYEYHVKDIPFKELNRNFIEKFVVYLSTVKGLASGTISAGVKKLRLMTYTAEWKRVGVPSRLSGSMPHLQTPPSAPFVTCAALAGVEVRNTPNTLPGFYRCLSFSAPLRFGAMQTW